MGTLGTCFRLLELLISENFRREVAQPPLWLVSGKLEPVPLSLARRAILDEANVLKNAPDILFQNLSKAGLTRLRVQIQPCEKRLCILPGVRPEDKLPDFLLGQPAFRLLGVGNRVEGLHVPGLRVPAEINGVLVRQARIAQTAGVHDASDHLRP